jgi:PncC family amidohydrolase
MTPSTFNSFLKERSLTIATAESITAGLLCSRIASVAGASSVLKGGIVTYDEKLKVRLLGVKPETLAKYSAESAETTLEMLSGLAKLDFDASVYIAVTGVASASVNAYQLTKPVGQVYIAISYKNKTYSFETILQPNGDSDSRNQIRERAVSYIFEKISEIIILF